MSKINITVRMDQTTADAVKALADADRRSVSSQILVWVLEKVATSPTCAKIAQVRIEGEGQ